MKCYPIRLSETSCGCEALSIFWSSAAHRLQIAKLLVLLAMMADTDTPHELVERLPKNQLSIRGVRTFLSIPLNSPVGPYKSASTCFSSLPPTSNSANTAVKIVPPFQWLEACKRILDDPTQRTKFRSVEDLRYRGVRHPFGTISWWQACFEINEIRALWDSCEEWLRTSSGSINRPNIKMALAADDIRDLFDHLPSNGYFRLLGNSYRITSLARLLSNNMISDDVIDATMAHFADRAQYDEDEHLRKRVIIASSHLYATIRDEGDARVSKQHDYYRLLLTEGKRTHLVMPVFTEYHCFACVLDVNEKTLAYGKFLCIR
jgi:hypothetical protein